MGEVEKVKETRVIQTLSDKVKLRGLGKETFATKVKREGAVCLYERDDDIFEVFVVKVDKEKEIFGKDYPTREVYPSNESFGVSAWCYNKLEEAEVKFRKVVKGVNLS